MVDIGSLLPKVGECGRYRESPAKGGRVWWISGVSCQRWESVVDIGSLKGGSLLPKVGGDIGSLIPKVGECGGYQESPAKGGREWYISGVSYQRWESGGYRESPAKGGRVW